MGTVRVNVHRKHPRRGRTDFARLRSLSDAEIQRRALSDPDCPPLTRKELAEMERVPDVRALRMKLKLTQAAFARRYGLTLRTIQDWEQGRFEPDQASRTLIRLIERIPTQVAKALAGARRSGTHG